MCGAGIDLEAEIYSMKLANETSPRTSMHDIKGEEGETSENSAYHLCHPWGKTTLYSKT
jgi:hypothetical protein